MKKKYILLFVALPIVAGMFFGIRTFSRYKKNNHQNAISYNRDIRPLLSDKCFMCHGPDGNKRRVGLRLDLPSGAYSELQKNKGHFAIVPGSPERSELMRRIESTDPSVLMPLPESHLTRLTRDEITLFRKWIKEGAHYEKHWAFVAPVKVPLPEVNDKSWVKNEIDNFILAKLEQKGLIPTTKQPGKL